MDIIQLIIGLELLGINLYVCFLCLTPKYDTRTLIRVFVVFTIGVVLIATGVRQLLDTVTLGSGFNTVFGLLYFYPIYSLFKESLKKTMFVTGLAYLYSLIVFGLAYSFVIMINFANVELLVLLFQSLLILCSIYWYQFIVKGRIVYIVRNLNDYALNTILWLTLFWLVTLFVFQLQIRYFDSVWLAFVLYVLIASSIVISYFMFYNLVELNNKANSLDKKTKEDTLTKLKNRDMLMIEGNLLIEQNTQFTLIFIDLDYFKAVNDTYSHSVGDKYLQLFVKEAISIVGSKTNLYRLSGDEFVYIVIGDDMCTSCEKLNALTFSAQEDLPHFLGLSLGCARYPSDGETLTDILHIADTKMYQIKKDKHRIAPEDLKI